ncbi:hypothetical protein [Kitasatospora sp. HPMI-4]|uniref:hypothetical protein n=1 Tax=Kitasatospora sp. HPMI-4 TaxID=3448443 RepID=UPI003F19C50F
MIRPPAKVRRTALALERLAGYRAAITWAPRLGFRITVQVPRDLDEPLALVVLAVLGQGRRYGHRYTSTRETVWTELSRHPVLAAARRPSEHITDPKTPAQRLGGERPFSPAVNRRTRKR